MKTNKGVSMISLVITIIVIIILAAVAFGSSTDTIENANFSNFTNDIAEVQNLLTEKAVTLRGTEGQNGTARTDAQVYNFIAKGATTLENGEDYWLSRSEANGLACTQLSGDVMKEVIDYELPEIKVATNGQNSVKCSYFVTNTGKVFVWPPYIYQDELYVNGDTKISGDAKDNFEAVFKSGYDFTVDDVKIIVTTGNASGDVPESSEASIFYNDETANTVPAGFEAKELYKKSATSTETSTETETE